MRSEGGKGDYSLHDHECPGQILRTYSGNKTTDKADLSAPKVSCRRRTNGCSSTMCCGALEIADFFIISIAAGGDADQVAVHLVLQSCRS